MEEDKKKENKEKSPKEVFKPKLRITLLSDKGVPQSDRLVEAYPELVSGPKIQHNGPIRLEVTLTNKKDVEDFKTYIDRLSGTLPIKEVSGRGRPSGSSSAIELSSPRENILQDVEKLVEEGKDQNEITKYLRKLGFVFILTEEFLYHFKDFPFEVRDIGQPNENGQYTNSFSWMVRQIKKAKDPKTDKYDPQIIFGFSILKGPSHKIVPYLYKNRQKPLRCKPAKKQLSFSQVGFTKYPPYMMEEERLKFSTEIRQLLNTPTKKPSKFFIRWYRDVIFPESIKDKMEQAYNKFFEGEKK